MIFGNLQIISNCYLLVSDILLGAYLQNVLFMAIFAM